MNYKIKPIFLFLLTMLIFSSTSLYAQDKKSFGEIGAGLFNVQGGAYRVLSEKSVIGVNAYAGFIFPSLLAQVSPQYKYYFNGITSNKNRGSFVAISGLNMLVVNLPGGKNETMWNVGAYANFGLGYEWNFRNFIIRPTISVGVPIMKVDKKDSYSGELLGFSIYSTMFQTLSISYRF